MKNNLLDYFVSNRVKSGIIHFNTGAFSCTIPFSEVWADDKHPHITFFFDPDNDLEQNAGCFQIKCAEVENFDVIPQDQEDSYLDYGNMILKLYMKNGLVITIHHLVDDEQDGE